MFRKNDGDILNDDGYAEFEKSTSQDLTLPIEYHNEEEEDKVMTTSQKTRERMREKYGITKN